MKKYAVFLLFVALSFSAFTVKNIDVDITLEKDGSVIVKETIDLLITTDVDIVSYSGNLERTDLASWAELIDDEDVKLHVNRNVVDVKELKVRPQPLRNYDPVNERANGKIVVVYKALPYFKEGKVVEGTGLFISRTEKPRVVVYALNPDALSFKKTSTGNLILNEKTTLRINIPPNAYVVDVNPIPLNIESLKFPMQVESVYWRASILPNLSFVVEVRQNLDEEIRVFFENKFNTFVEYLSTYEGKVLFLFVAFVVVFYIILIKRVVRSK